MKSILICLIVWMGISVLFTIFKEDIPKIRRKKIIKKVCNRLYEEYTILLENLTFEDLLKGIIYYDDFLKAFKQFCKDKGVSLDYLGLREEDLLSIKKNGGILLISKCFKLLKLKKISPLNSYNKGWFDQNICDMEGGFSSQNFEKIETFIRSISREMNINLSSLRIEETDLQDYKKYWTE